MGSFSPVPGFPDFSGPFPVGSVDLETPVSDLPSPAKCPQEHISTVNFRLWYPCSKSIKKAGSVYWIEEPQQEHVSAFARFLGAGNALSSALSYIPNLIYFTKIPVLKNAPILSPEPSPRKWPIVVFSHGLGGSRTSYSHVCGLLASYGVVVVAPEHRDGSAPISLIRDKDAKIIHRVEYRSIGHTVCQEVHDARHEQLKIRLWELATTYEALVKLNEGTLLKNYSVQQKGVANPQDLMHMFSDKLDLRRGKVTFSGHSFGAATAVQFVKSVYWKPSESELHSYSPMISLDEACPIIQQVTPDSTLVLLDPWGLPLNNPRTKWLNDKPLPGFQRHTDKGRNILAVLSEAFFRWNANLLTIKRMLSDDPSKERHKHAAGTGPHLFYPEKAAHLSQSDFGILFPTLTKLAVKSTEPARILRLNIRAMLEVMRLNGIDVADTSSVDMELSTPKTQPKTQIHTRHGPFDRDILKTDGSVRGWIALRVGYEDHDDEGGDTATSEAVEPMEAAVDGKM